MFGEDCAIADFSVAYCYGNGRWMDGNKRKEQTIRSWMIQVIPQHMLVGNDCEDIARARYDDVV